MKQKIILAAVVGAFLLLAALPLTALAHRGRHGTWRDCATVGSCLQDRQQRRHHLRDRSCRNVQALACDRTAPGCDRGPCGGAGCRSGRPSGDPGSGTGKGN